jgi:hypothetical protein
MIAGMHRGLEPQNMSFYQRDGFEVIGEVQMGSAPLITPMHVSHADHVRHDPRGTVRYTHAAPYPCVQLATR